jgi:hypothetical protein
MFYYECKRCKFVTKQKIDMQRHLQRINKCKQKWYEPKSDKTDIELDKESLTKIYMKDELGNIKRINRINHLDNITNINNLNNIEDLKMIDNEDLKMIDKEKQNNEENKTIKIEIKEEEKKEGEYECDKENRYICKYCNNMYHNKSNLNKHINNQVCLKKIKRKIQNIETNKMELNNISETNLNQIEKIIENKVNQQINNINIQNIGVQNNNNIIINIGSIKGFDEEWNTSNISKDTREKLLLSDKKFTNTLNNILLNKDNLNVVIKNENTGFVYKNSKKEYEAMHNKDIFNEAMDKLYKHLRDFFKETVSNNINDIKLDILNKEMNEIDKKYIIYKESEKTKRMVNSCLSDIFERKNDESINNLISVINCKKKKKLEDILNVEDIDY